MTPTAENSSKRRHRNGPPRFQHLPAERARKLKKDWVEKKKIKSIWRRQRRKHGLLAVQAGGTSQEEATIKPSEAMEPENTELSGEELDRVDVDQSIPSATTSLIAPRPSAEKPQIKPRSFSPSQIDKSRQMPEIPSITHRERSRRFLSGQASRRGGGFVRGKGKQPDMRVKMGKLLEKIKQNHTG